jgi:threonine/homoserine/homoserine lactone efflux protein
VICDRIQSITVSRVQNRQAKTIGMLLGMFMHMSFFLKGLVIGISIAAPVGPIGVLCIQRTLAAGRLPGLVSGLGAATADSFYGLIAGFGLTIVSSFLVERQMWFRLIGGAFLIFLGIRAFLSAPVHRDGSVKAPKRVGAYGSTFFLTIINPMTILSFGAIFAGLGLVNSSANYVSALVLVIGVFLGSTIWWLILSSITGVFREKVSHGSLRWVNRIPGAIITCFGLLSILSL